MSTSNVCWGIELGAGSLKALKLRASGDDVEVVDFAYIPHKRVLSTPDIDAAEMANMAMRTLASQFDLSGASIAISVPGHSAFARFAKLPPVEPKKIKDIVKFEAVQQIPFPLEEVEWDYQTFRSPDSPDVEVGIFAMTRERVMERLAQWGQDDVGVTPDIITLSPVAAYNAIAYDLRFSEKTPGTVILDVGTTSTDLIVAEAGRVWIRTFPIGGHQFTEALVNTFKLAYPKAEKLKREAETSKHARHVFQAMRPVFSDLAQDVQRSIGYYQSLHRDANLTRLIALGSTFNIPGLKKYLSQQLQMEVIQLDSFQRLKAEGPRADEFRSLTGQFATAYGLALQGVGLQTIDANLMPVAVLRDAMWQRKTKWFGVAAGLALVAGGVSFIKPMMDRGRIDAQTPPASIQQVKQELQTLKRKWDEVAGKEEKDYRGANALLLLENRDVYRHLIADVGEMLADAQRKASKSPATLESQKAGFMLRRMDTRYLYGEVSGSASSAPAAQTPAGGRRRSRRNTPGVVDAGAPAAKSDATGPRIQVVLEVATTQPDPERFVSETLYTWLNANAKREGKPYALSYLRREKLGVEVVRAATTESDQGERGAGILSAGRDRGAQIIGGRGTGGATQRPGDFAPLPPPPPPAEEGASVTTFLVYFEALLAGGEGSKPAENPE